MTEQLPISAAHEKQGDMPTATTTTTTAAAAAAADSEQNEVAPPLPKGDGSSKKTAMSHCSLAQAAVTAVLGFASFSPRFRALNECDKHHVVIAIQRFVALVCWWWCFWWWWWFLDGI